MEVRLITAVICWALLVCCVSSQVNDCDGHKWFGSQCIYKCRCTNDMCDTNGVCTSGARCQGGWFGPACQYADLAYNRPTDRQVTDGNDDTCTSTSSGSVTVTLENSYVFTWMRVRVSRPDHLHHLTVQFRNDSSLSCINPRNATVDDNTLDIHCDLSETVQSVTLTGEAVRYLCSVHISGGRNVALKQNTSQSGNYSESGTTFTSDKSVDGSTSGRFDMDKSCSSTANLPTTPNWNVTFSHPRLVNRYLVYRRTDGFPEQLRGFKLESFHPNNTRIFTYTNTAPSTQDVYTVTANVTSLIYLVNITPDYSTKTFLQMCEVEVYGDSNCEPGRYGRECNKTCNCAGGQLCFISTGGCPSGCAAGFYGESCDLPCKPGTYGEGCKANCSEFCSSDERSCDRINGSCLHGCKSGYQEPTCTSPCMPGLYGPGCSNSCSMFCTKNTNDVRSCNVVNGACDHGCETGYQKPTCTAPCQRGRYGQDCSSTCSQFCVDTNITTDSVCDHITGVCAFGCHSDHQASFCQAKGVSGQVDVIAVVVGSVVGVIVLIVVVLALIIFKRKRRRTRLEIDQLHFMEMKNDNGSLYVSNNHISEEATVSSVIQPEETLHIQSPGTSYTESVTKEAVNIQSSDSTVQQTPYGHAPSDANNVRQTGYEESVSIQSCDNRVIQSAHEEPAHIQSSSSSDTQSVYEDLVNIQSNGNSATHIDNEKSVNFQSTDNIATQSVNVESVNIQSTGNNATHIDYEKQVNIQSTDTNSQQSVYEEPEDIQSTSNNAQQTVYVNIPSAASSVKEGVYEESASIHSVSNSVSQHVYEDPDTVQTTANSVSQNVYEDPDTVQTTANSVSEVVIEDPGTVQTNANSVSEAVYEDPGTVQSVANSPSQTVDDHSGNILIASSADQNVYDHPENMESGVTIAEVSDYEKVMSV